MNANAAIMSVVARYLSSAGFRNEISADAQRALTGCHVSADARRQLSELDFQALESFGGLITKTQHNFLYEYLPYTRQLLRTYRLDLTVFSAYRTEAQLNPVVMSSRSEKTRRFLAYLKFWLDGKDQEFPGLADLLEHERILWELKNEAVVAVVELRRAGPCLQPSVKMAQFRSNPFGIIESLKDGGRPLKNQRRTCQLIYWLNTQDSEIRIAKPSRTVWKILQLCDGTRGLRSLYRQLAPLPPATIRSAIASARASGLIVMGDPG